MENLLSLFPPDEIIERPSGWRTFLGPLLFFILICFVWFVRYQIWHWFNTAETLFTMLIFSYLVVFLLSICFLKKDAKKSLAKVFKVRNCRMILVGAAFAFLFQAAWSLISFGIGSRVESLLFPSLKGYENYPYYSIFLAFALYLSFAIFGGFVEEVAFREYIQSKIASGYGQILSVFISSLLFSLQHIHVFELNWIGKFFQSQFIYVFCFGIFVGYLFFKSKENLWSVFAFHAFMNFFNVSLPFRVIPVVPFADQPVTIAVFALMILLVRFLPFKWHQNSK